LRGAGKDTVCWDRPFDQFSQLANTRAQLATPPDVVQCADKKCAAPPAELPGGREVLQQLPPPLKTARMRGERARSKRRGVGVAAHVHDEIVGAEPVDPDVARRFELDEAGKGGPGEAGEIEAVHVRAREARSRSHPEFRPAGVRDDVGAIADGIRTLRSRTSPSRTISCC
jgi:hypothetical protein